MDALKVAEEGTVCCVSSRYCNEPCASRHPRRLEPILWLSDRR